jgi:hypothetical protein
MSDKKAYFQGGGGVNEPTPKKKKYKSDPALVNQPRFKEPLYRNYDLYNTPGEHSPGAGYHDMTKYKSVSDFLKAKRKKLKHKYKADDSWIQDDGSITKENPDKKSRMKARAALLSKLTKIAIDFPLDEYSQPDVSSGIPEDIDVPLRSGGYSHRYVPHNDLDDKSPSALNFGRDYPEQNTCRHCKKPKIDVTFSCEHCGKGGPLVAKEPAILGLLDGIVPIEDLDADKTIGRKNPEYGTTNAGNIPYFKI